MPTACTSTVNHPSFAELNPKLMKFAAANHCACNHEAFLLPLPRKMLESGILLDGDWKRERLEFMWRNEMRLSQKKFEMPSMVHL